MFPVVILTVLAVVYILIAMYTDASTAVRDHLALRHESGTRTETVERAGAYNGLAPADKYGRRPFRQSAEIYEERVLLDRRLVADGSRVYIIDEEKHVRTVDFVKGLVNSNEKDNENENDNDNE